MGLITSFSVIVNQGPCDACAIRNKYRPDRHVLGITACGRALCRECECRSNCYDRHIPSCDFCSVMDNREVANQMVADARKAAGLDPMKVTITALPAPRRWA